VGYEEALFFAEKLISAANLPCESEGCSKSLLKSEWDSREEGKREPFLSRNLMIPPKEYHSSKDNENAKW